MNCFVIMPFDASFDDVYASIKTAVERVVHDQAIRCFRLDENRPAGRITDRLLSELRQAEICIADLTGSKPNVMWEVGYAMALQKPLIIVTQRIDEMPFDLKDMESIQYDRNHLSQTLGINLQQLVRDTIASVSSPSVGTEPIHDGSDEGVVGALKSELSELKAMVGQLVRAWNPAAINTERVKTADASTDAVAGFEGAWFNPESNTHLYSRVVNGQLIAPYCYGGNDRLTGVYYDWSKAGEYWFARFSWLASNVSGFAFLKLMSADRLHGAWWMNEDFAEIPNAPPDKSGIPSTLERRHGAQIPIWAEQFFDEAREGDVISSLNRVKAIIVDGSPHTT